ncbi:GNAT family N-acetyltransferase [Amycolatopsis rifamycinica]|uniref:GNAT family acetyltraansferase n=1 Tax=Amycolatopsis rifamycinica TaxID=287986 RepID=A0A066U7D8_9PSEU|nr:GNAT family N-acetyltransferase [Amycolatopsis rifamycinica]KDN21752.1 GNAT family acetyltraansferase [Amycolatopsis rifamycinica]
MTTTVRRNDTESRYKITVDGDLAGFAAYADHDGRRIMYHTEIFDAFSGRGLSSTLIAGALDDLRGSGTRVVPVCPLVVAYLRKHPDQDDIADPAGPETLRWLQTVLR